MPYRIAGIDVHKKMLGPPGVSATSLMWRQAGFVGLTTVKEATILGRG